MRVADAIKKEIEVKEGEGRMSTYYWEKRQRSQNIPITSIRCLVEALTTSSIQLTNVPVEVQSLIHAEQSYAEALAAYEQSSLTSLDDVKTMQANIEALIAANETLHEALITAENKLPETLNFKNNGVSYSAKRAAGSYRITWTEEVQTYNGRETGQTRGGEDSRAFVNQLCRSYETAQTRHNNERSRLQKAMAELNSELPTALDQAIRVRTAWEQPKRPSVSRTWSMNERTTSSQKVKPWASRPVFLRWRLRVSRRSSSPWNALFLRPPRRARKAVLASVSTVADC